MMNLTIAGHLGDDVEERVTPSGQKVATLRMAVNTRRGGKDETVWWRITIWGDRFGKMFPYLKKGSGVIVTGRMHAPQIYTDRAGHAQVALEMTAEMIDFSPFGRSGKAQETSSAAYPGFSQKMVAEGHSSEAERAAAPYNAFGQPHPSSVKTFGKASEEYETEDDPLPF